MSELVEQYIQQFPLSVQQKLLHIRHLIQVTKPALEEGMSYGVPAFRYRGKSVIMYAAFSHHIGVYPTPSVIVSMKNDLADYETSKGTVKLPLEQPIPDALIRKMVSLRMKELE